jgi:undecaprenyl phosphate-alpha-L-ara4N flippase subunit ArnE
MTGLRFYLLCLSIFLLWFRGFFLLSRVSIVKAFPFFGVSFFFVPVMAGFFLGEDVGRGVFIGAVLIFFGVLVSVFFK